MAWYDFIERVAKRQGASGNTVPVEVTGSHTPTVYNVTMTNANTEYSQALPANTKKFSVSLQSNDAAYRLAFATGKVAAPTAPYLTIAAGYGYEESFNGSADSLTIYAACGVAGKVLQIVAWA